MKDPNNALMEVIAELLPKAEAYADQLSMLLVYENKEFAIPRESIEGIISIIRMQAILVRCLTHPYTESQDILDLLASIVPD